MAYYKYSEATGELIEISDFPMQPASFQAVSEVPVSAADLMNIYSWDPSTLAFGPKVTVVVTKKEFLKRITPNEYAAIKAAAASNGMIDYYWQLFMVAENIDLKDPDTVQGIQTLEQIGLLAAGRSDEILG